MAHRQLEKIIQESKVKMATFRLFNYSSIWKAKCEQQNCFSLHAFLKHRKDSFESCSFIMDYLKKDAPFWKNEFYDKEK